MIDIIIWIDPEIMTRIEAVAHERLQAKIGTIRAPRIKEEVTNLDVERNGLMGEFACAFYLGGEVDTNLYQYGDGGIDMEIAGKTIQIKCTFVESGNGSLLFMKPQDLVADFAVKCDVLRDGTIKLGGYVSRQEFMQKQQARSYGHGWRASMLPHELHPIQELKELLNGNLYDQAPAH